MLRFFKLTKAQYNKVKDLEGVTFTSNVVVEGSPKVATLWVCCTPDEIEDGTELTTDAMIELVNGWAVKQLGVSA